MTAIDEQPCLSCGAENLAFLFGFGKVPLAGRLLLENAVTQADQLYELDIAWCRSCSLVQVLSVPAPEILFDKDYPYFSSISTSLGAEMRGFAQQVVSQHGLKSSSKVLEIASNDGYLLREFKNLGIPVLGVDPAPGPVAVARELGIETLCAFFDLEFAKHLAQDGQRFDLLVANNVLAHVPDPNNFIQGVKMLLKPNGTAMFTVGYVCDLVEKTAFDTIYHEHQSYFTLHALVALFGRNDLRVQEVEKIPAQGGSLRINVTHSLNNEDKVSSSVSHILSIEKQSGALDGTLFEGFGKAVDTTIGTIENYLNKLAATGARIAAYGAAAKGTILLSALNLQPECILYVADNNPYKQNKFMSAMRLPIVSPEYLIRDNPDYVLILPWNLADEIADQLNIYLENGGRLIIPLPEPVLFPAD